MALTKVTSSVLDTLTGLTVTAADGVADNDFVASISNQEATDGRSFGLAINAGSTGSDFALNINTHDAGANLMRLKGSGDCHFPNASAFGIGTDSASRELDIQAASGWAELALRGASGSAGSLEYYNASTKLAEIYADTSTNIIFRNSTGGTTERMRIDSSGQLLIGCTATPSASVDGLGLSLASAILSSRGGTGFDYHVRFFNPNGQIGYISTQNSATQYNTSSDYRLKENVIQIQNGLERLNQLNPVKFDWKEDGTSSEGFIAHEVQEIFPDAVSGEKDGEEMQGMDYGRITPLLVKAIQEQQEEIEQLKQNSHAPKTIEEMEGYEDLINRIKELENK
jgi:hypothetical protein